MTEITTQAPGKINVCLYVGGTRETDGRHAVVTVMQAVDLCDTVTVADAPQDALHCPGVEGDNLATAALVAFRARVGLADPVAITVVKRIPVAAGMAGGSADAGAVLRLLDAHFATGLGDDVLRDLAAGLGADVPAQVRPGRWLGTGAGEVVTGCPEAEPYGVVVLPHPEPLSTPEVFRAFDGLGPGRSTAELARLADSVGARAGDLPDDLVVNDLEAAAVSRCPAIGDSLQRMRSAGAELTLVSGSGPTVLGLTRDPADAPRVAERVGGGAIATRTWAATP